VDALVPRLDFAALAQSVYLNQAALGPIPAQSLEVMREHLTPGDAILQKLLSPVSGPRPPGVPRVAFRQRCESALEFRGSGSALRGGVIRHCIPLRGSALRARLTSHILSAYEIACGAAHYIGSVQATDRKSMRAIREGM
jgi:hypothetical protein